MTLQNAMLAGTHAYHLHYVYLATAAWLTAKEVMIKMMMTRLGIVWRYRPISMPAAAQQQCNLVCIILSIIVWQPLRVDIFKYIFCRRHSIADGTFSCAQEVRVIFAMAAHARGNIASNSAIPADSAHYYCSVCPILDIPKRLLRKENNVYYDKNT